MIGPGTAAFYTRSERGLDRTRQQAERLQEQIATGARLARPSDDPVAAARLRTLARADAMSKVDAQAGDRAAQRYAATAQTLGEVANIVVRAKELTLQAASATLSSADRGMIGTQIASLFDASLSLANSRDAFGAPLFALAGDSAAYVANAAGATYTGGSEPPRIDLGGGQSVPAGMIGPEAFGLQGNGAAPDLFTTLKTLADGLRSGDDGGLAAARGGIAALDESLGRLTAAQTIAGTREAFVDTVAQGRSDRAVTRFEEQARLGDADLALTISELRQTMTILEASQAGFARLADLSLFDVLR